MVSVLLGRTIVPAILKGGEVVTNYNCENCGWSESVGSSILWCNYNDNLTGRNECCMAWKSKEKETNMVEVVRCKDCKHGEQLFPDYISCRISDENESGCHASHKPEWFCADGERKDE